MTVRKVVALITEVDDRPGVLGEMAGPVADAGINLLALYGGPAGEGRAKIACVPDDPGKLRGLAAEGGVSVEERELLFLEGDDRPGAGAEIARKLANAGVNIQAILGTGSAGKFAICIAVAPEDLDRAASALGA